MRTRPDTRPIPVADGWAGADMRVFTLSNSIITDQRTDGRTDGRTDKGSYRVACPQLKRISNIKRGLSSNLRILALTSGIGWDFQFS